MVDHTCPPVTWILCCAMKSWSLPSLILETPFGGHKNIPESWSFEVERSSSSRAWTSTCDFIFSVSSRLTSLVSVQPGQSGFHLISIILAASRVGHVGWGASNEHGWDWKALGGLFCPNFFVKYSPLCHIISGTNPPSSHLCPSLLVLQDRVEVRHQHLTRTKDV